MFTTRSTSPTLGPGGAALNVRMPVRKRNELLGVLRVTKAIILTEGPKRIMIICSSEQKLQAGLVTFQIFPVIGDDGMKQYCADECID
jgi:hypothetical protein